MNYSGAGRRGEGLQPGITYTGYDGCGRGGAGRNLAQS